MTSFMLNIFKSNTQHIFAGRRVIVTDSWIVKLSTYDVFLARQTDSVLRLLRSDDHSVTPDGPGGAQFLTIQVTSTDPRHKPFTIR